MDVSPDIQAAIDCYTPGWRPPTDALTDWVVAIDPFGGGSTDPAVQDYDDLALAIGALLFHYIQWAGGVPLMTRADDLPARPAVPPLPEAIDVTLSIACVPAAAGEGAPAESFISQVTVGSNSSELARALAEAFESAPTAPPRKSASGAPAGMVTLSIALAGRTLDRPRTLAREIAAKVCAGLIEFASSAEGASIRGDRASYESSGTSALPAPIPRFIDRPEDVEIGEIARTIWPHGPLPPNLAAWFCDMWRRVALSDRSFVFFQPVVAQEDGAIIIRGATNVACMRDVLPAALRSIGLEGVRSEMRLLPEDCLLDGERFGVSTATTALTYATASESSGLRTQLLYGEPLHLLDRDAGFVLVHGADGYWGWVRKECVQVLSADDFLATSTCPRAVLVHDVELGDRRLLRGTTLPFAFSISGSVTLTCPDGEQYEVSANDVRAFDHTNEAVERAQRALALLHKPYVYGGVSPLGLDCSGLVQTLADQTGLSLPRDAAQQFPMGRLVATRWHREGMRTGDLLYFINPCGRIFHVAIALDSTHFIHSGPPEVKIDSLQPGDRLYSAARAATFLAARRW